MPKQDFQIFPDEFPLYGQSFKKCPAARYVGGASRYLCECQKPNECKGVAMSRRYYSVMKRGGLIDAARVAVGKYGDWAEDYLIASWQAVAGLALIKDACGLVREEDAIKSTN